MADADFTVNDVLLWARTKPADETYDVCVASACAVGQFGTATGRTYVHEWGSPEHKLRAEGLDDALGFSGDCEMTFGALVTRLEALLPETVINESNWARLDAYMNDIEAVAADHVMESAQ